MVHYLPIFVLTLDFSIKCGFFCARKLNVLSLKRFREMTNGTNWPESPQGGRLKVPGTEYNNKIGPKGEWIRKKTTSFEVERHIGLDFILWCHLSKVIYTKEHLPSRWLWCIVFLWEEKWQKIRHLYPPSLNSPILPWSPSQKKKYPKWCQWPKRE